MKHSLSSAAVGLYSNPWHLDFVFIVLKLRPSLAWNQTNLDYILLQDDGLLTSLTSSGWDIITFISNFHFFNQMILALACSTICCDLAVFKGRKLLVGR